MQSALCLPGGNESIAARRSAALGRRRSALTAACRLLSVPRPRAALARAAPPSHQKGSYSVEIPELRSRHPDHWKRAAALRVLAMDAVQAANSGHPGMPMGMADVATVLFEKHLKFDAAAPDWPDRDRFVLSAGHGSMLLYGLLHLTGYDGHDARRAQELPPGGLEDRRTPGIRPRRRHRDHHRPARPGPRQRRRHGDGRREHCARASGARSSTTTLRSSPATAA